MLKKISMVFIVLLLIVLSIPFTGFSAANVYLPDSSGTALNWDFDETPPKRPNLKLLNSANYEYKWKRDNSLLFNLVQDKNGVLYMSDADNKVHAVYPNGKEKWSVQLDMGFELSVIYLILGQDGTIYAYSSDFLTQPGMTSIYALSPEGKVKWYLPPDTMVYSRFDSHFAGDSHGNFVYFSADGLISRNAKGEVNWTNKEIRTSDPNKPSPSTRSSYLFIDPKGNIYVDSESKEIISINPDGTERWRSTPQSYLNQFDVFYPYFSDAGILYMLTSSGLHALTGTDGSQVKLSGQSDLSDIRSSGIPTDGNGGYYFENRGDIQKLDYKGAIKWSYIPRPSEKYGPGSTKPLVTDDKGNLYFGTGVGNIIGLNSDGQEIFAFLRNAYWYKHTEVVIGNSGNLYSINDDIGLVAFGKKQIQVYQDNRYLPMSVAPIMDNGSVLVPFRSLFESMGLKVGWNSSSQTITGTKEGLTIQMKMGSRTAYVNGQAKSLSIAPKMFKNSTFVPLRFVAEALGKNVSWDSKSSSVNINSKV
ncbi:outer membrane protein assembly factor BamB [Paenibacillus sp. BK033]|uniref:stalk domain-containing protein n=1 Tax=Paenibacillus sp. BK033 TaxID=2512133 RepID=UPI00104C1433|nr:stalk domain-containing protein [Paenibacillus sp. BK033]TCM92720.1 outer membrane protein assembly factor BamB [Paenibacillus sp. BK033]